MLELPETKILSEEICKNLIGKVVWVVLLPSKAHKFCWYNGEPEKYDGMIKESRIESSDGFGIYVEINFSNGYHMCVNDGVNARLVNEQEIPRNYQLAIIFTDATALVFSVAMYGGIILYKDVFDSEFYFKSKNAVNIFSDVFREHFDQLRAGCKTSMSAKAFVATEQRFPGIGNGCSQDILFKAGLHPKRKIGTFSEEDWERLYDSIRSVVKDMINKGGRDTEKDLFGNAGGYKVLMSKNSLASGCPVCGGEITKETFLGGSVYYCSKCQPLVK